MTKEHKTITLYDTYNYSYNLGVEDALYTPHFDPDDTWIAEWEEWNDKKWNKEDIWANIQEHPDWEFNANDFWEAVKTFDDKITSRVNYCKPGELAGYLITGKLGLWHGSPNIYPTFCHTLEDALRMCGNDMDNFKVDICNGVITCYGYHHDGTNVFTIYGVSCTRMTEKQIELLFEAGNKRPIYDEAQEKLFANGNKRHIRKINFLKVLGWCERALLKDNNNDTNSNRLPVHSTG